MIRYKKILTDNGIGQPPVEKSVMKIDGTVTAFIPFDDKNIDYQEYLKWLALGNVPESAV